MKAKLDFVKFHAVQQTYCLSEPACLSVRPLWNEDGYLQMASEGKRHQDFECWQEDGERKFLHN